MMNRFESRWFIAISGEVYHLVRNRLVTLVLVQQSKFPSITKLKKEVILPDALSAIDAAKQLKKKIIWSENDFNRFYDETVITDDEHKLTFQNSFVN